MRGTRLGAVVGIAIAGIIASLVVLLSSTRDEEVATQPMAQPASTIAAADAAEPLPRAILPPIPLNVSESAVPAQPPAAAVADPSPEPVALPSAASLSISGRAIWPSGTPAVGAQVSLQASRGEVGDASMGEGTVQGVRTDDNGRFAFATVEATRTYRISFCCLEGIEQVFTFNEIAPSQSSRDYVLAPDQQCQQPVIGGRVVDANSGLPVPQFETRICEARWPADWSVTRTWNDGTGQFRYEDVNTSTPYYLQVLVEGVDRLEPELTANVGPLIPGRGACEIEILVGAAGSLLVHVVDEADQPIGLGQVELCRAGVGWFEDGIDHSLDRTLDVEGEAHWPDLAPGWYWVSLSLRDRWGAALVYVPAAEVATARIRVLVRGAGTVAVNLLPSARKSAADPNSLQINLEPAGMWTQDMRVSLKPDQHGRCLVPHVIAGEYVVRLRGAEGASSRWGHVFVLPGAVAELNF